MNSEGLYQSPTTKSAFFTYNNAPFQERQFEKVGNQAPLPLQTEQVDPRLLAMQARYIQQLGQLQNQRPQTAGSWQMTPPIGANVPSPRDAVPQPPTMQMAPVQRPEFFAPGQRGPIATPPPFQGGPSEGKFVSPASRGPVQQAPTPPQEGLAPMPRQGQRGAIETYLQKRRNLSPLTRRRGF